MDRVRFYADEHVSWAVINGLRQRGIDVQSAVEVHLLGADDRDHLAFAITEGRVIFTQDADFLRLASEYNHAGIAYATQQTPISRVIFGLLLISQVLDAQEMIGNIEYL